MRFRRGQASSRRGLALAGALFAVALALPAESQETAVFFRQNCASCHTIGGGRLVGPDLKDVAQRKDRDWLARFVSNPKAVLDSGDPYVLRLKDEARGAIMPPVAGMTRERAIALLDLIDAESKLEKSQFMGLSITDEPFRPEDIRRGRALFTGAVRLANGGAACLSCHNAAGLAGLAGGRLGPDLTRVYERMQGRKNLATWLQAPATPTMQPVFAVRPLTSEEILPLVAWLEELARTGGSPAESPRVAFLLLGLGGTAAGFMAADFIWRRRFREVRRPMVRAASGAAAGDHTSRAEGEPS